MEILKKVTELKAELDAMRPLNADRKAAIMQKLRLDWNFHSNHLEGNTLNYGETRALILFGITAAGKPLKDHFEMTGHDEAIKWVEDVVKENRPLTESFIRSLHKLILKEPYESPTVTPEGIPAKKIIKVGEYKSSPNHVLTPTGEIFRFATPEETPAKMHDLIEWYREKEKDEETHPLLLAAEFHYKFIRIHPFDDGNGRTARILMNFILMKYGYPPVIVRTEEKEDKYFPALRQADAGSITPFIEYLGINLAHSLDLMIRGAKGENIDEADDVDKEIALIDSKLKSIGKNVVKIKSIESILELFDNSLRYFFQSFIQAQLKFIKYYEAYELKCHINGSKGGFSEDPEKILDNIPHRISSNSLAFINSVSISISFKNFQEKGVEYFNFYTQIGVDFEKNTYSVYGPHKVKFYEKNYHINLTEIEILQIVKNSTEEHILEIKKKIEK